MKHSLAEIYRFGTELIETEDLDPVYCALYNARRLLPTDQLSRLLLAYFCFYHLGVAAHLSEFAGDPYWDGMEAAAANESHGWPIGHRTWPRGTERRHFRGEKCVKAVRYFRALGAPELVVQKLMTTPGRSLHLREVTYQVQGFPLFGPWIAFKVADMLERVCGVPIEFPNDIMTFYAEPRAALGLLAVPADEAIAALLKYFREFPAPPDYDRYCNIQEVETICCKWKSHVNGHYWIGKDICDIRKGLRGWGLTASKLLAVMPKEPDSDGLF